MSDARWGTMLKHRLGPPRRQRIAAGRSASPTGARPLFYAARGLATASGGDRCAVDSRNQYSQTDRAWPKDLSEQSAEISISSHGYMTNMNLHATPSRGNVCEEVTHDPFSRRS